MKRKIIAALLALTLLFGVVPSGLAHERDEHDKQLEKVLFGRDNYASGQEEDQKKAIHALQSAAYLCIDQFNGSGEDELKCLSAYGVPNIISSLDEINFKSNYAHRRYTHRGWIPLEHPDKGNWEERKKILLNTVNFVFDFGVGTDINIAGNPILGFKEQCDAFAALLYYTHLIGDIEDLETYKDFKKQGSYVMALVRSHPGDTNPDVLSELIDIYLPKVFTNSQQEFEYKKLISKLTNKAKHARNNKLTFEDIKDEASYQKYHDLATKVLDIMAEYIPDLLIKEKFFTDVFGTDR